VGSEEEDDEATTVMNLFVAWCIGVGLRPGVRIERHS
jgi:hypothetical protein